MCPNREQLKSIVLEEARTWSRRQGGRNVTTRKQLLDRLVDNLGGLPERDAKRLARGAIEDDGAITEEDLPEVMQAKFELLGQDGVLSYEYDTARFAEVGGLGRLKEWLSLREPVFAGTLDKPGLDIPKGILLLGVQGCGKSLAAKAVAGSWGLPLLRLDFGTLYDKYHGETERNLREALNQAEVMAPCVLWIDEIEKGLSTDGSDSGTSRRVLGTLLTWMAENDERAFLVATANDIETLPPELLRKGRMDEIFFVDLPDLETRRRILEIHLEKRDLRDPGYRRGGVGGRQRRLLRRGDRTGGGIRTVREPRARAGGGNRGAAEGDPRHETAVRRHGGTGRRPADLGGRAYGAGKLSPPMKPASGATGPPIASPSPASDVARASTRAPSTGARAATPTASRSRVPSEWLSRRRCARVRPVTSWRSARPCAEAAPRSARWASTCMGSFCRGGAPGPGRVRWVASWRGWPARSSRALACIALPPAPPAGSGRCSPGVSREIPPAPGCAAASFPCIPAPASARAAGGGSRERS